jgi:uncharacterized membrane-anchored protein YitT (DUF2179 family)
MKVLRIAWGFSLVAVGILLLFIPGPGLTTIVSGLAILARHFVWAARAIALIRNYLLTTARVLDRQLAPRRLRKRA